MTLIKNVLKPLAENVLITLVLTAAAAVAAFQKKMFGSGRPSDLASCMPILIISNEEMNDIMKIVKSLEESGLSIKGVSEQLKMKQKNKKEDFSECY